MSQCCTVSYTTEKQVFQCVAILCVTEALLVPVRSRLKIPRISYPIIVNALREGH